MMSNHNWLPGGPYYELSLILENSDDKENLLAKIMNILLNFPITIEESNLILQQKQTDFINKIADLDLNAFIDISGERKARLFLTEMSSKFISEEDIDW